MKPLPQLVLVPGLVCDDYVWEQQADNLRDLVDISIVALDDNTLSLMAEKILRSAATRFALAGHSMGARVALEVMRVAPERVERVALLDTGYAPLAAGEAGAREKAKRFELLAIARTQGMRAMAKIWAQGMVYPARLADEALMNGIYDMVERKTPEQFAKQIHALIERPDASTVLASIAVPTLIACGEQDVWSPWSQHVDMAQRVPGARLVSYANCGHMSTIEQPQLVSQSLRDWLQY
jgi:pimeloyl-ACP methyl ester carboxylesterase